jgi:hypothetical protein
VAAARLIRPISSERYCGLDSPIHWVIADAPPGGDEHRRRRPADRSCLAAVVSVGRLGRQRSVGRREAHARGHTHPKRGFSRQFTSSSDIMTTMGVVMVYQRILLSALSCLTQAGACSSLAHVGGRKPVPAMKGWEAAEVITGRALVTAQHRRGGAERGFEQGRLISRLSYRPLACDRRITPDDSREAADTTRGPRRFCDWERPM